MKYIELKQKLNDHIVFTQNDIKIISNNFNRQRLSDWQNKGYIKKIVKGYYIFSDLNINEYILCLIANKIYAPSYVSFEFALSLYNLIPEAVYGITSTTTRKTQKFQTSICNFYYSKIRPSLFFGYKLIKIKGQEYKFAEIEKAVLDYFYLRPYLKSIDDFKELRFDISSFKEQASMKKFNYYLKKFDNAALSARMKIFKRFLQND